MTFGILFWADGCTNVLFTKTGGGVGLEAKIMMHSQTLNCS